MTELYTRFDGRIDRKTWWIGVIVLFVALLVLSLVLGFLFGDGFIGRVISLLVGLAAIYPAAALATKRLHDRGKPMLPRVALFFAPGALVSLLDAVRLGYRPVQLPDGDVVMMPGGLVTILGLVSLGVLIWAVIELGILKGDPEPNSYGPPPG